MWRCFKLTPLILILGLYLGAPLQAEVLPVKGRVDVHGNYLIHWQNDRLWLRQKHRLNAPAQQALTFNQPIYQVVVQGAYLVVGFMNGSYQRFRFPSMASAGALKLPSNGHLIPPFAVSPDGYYLTRTLFSQQNAQDVMDLNTWSWQPSRWIQQRRAHQQPLHLPGHYPDTQILFHPLGQFLAFATEDGVLKIYDTQQKKWVYQLPGSPPLSYADSGTYFAFLSPCGAEQCIRLWHLPTGRLKTWRHTQIDASESALVIDPAGHYLAYTTRAQGKLRELRVQRIADGKRVFSTRVAEAVDSLTFFDASHVLASSIRNSDYAATRHEFL